MQVYENGELVEKPDDFTPSQEIGSTYIYVVTAAQAKIALFRRGLLDQVETLIKLYPRDIQIWYESALHWERYNPYVIGIGLELGVTAEEMDQLFIEASKL